MLVSKGGGEERGEWNKMQILTRFNRAATHGEGGGGHKTTPLRPFALFPPQTASLARKERAIEKPAILFRIFVTLLRLPWGGLPAWMDRTALPFYVCLRAAARGENVARP